MRLIGNKTKLLDFIHFAIEKTLKENNDNRKLEDLILMDGFSGTGSVATFFKNEIKAKKVIANDLQYFSYINLKALLNILTVEEKVKTQEIIKQLNQSSLSFYQEIKHIFSKYQYDIESDGLFQNNNSSVILKEINNLPFFSLKQNLFLKNENKNFEGFFLFNHYAIAGLSNQEYKRTYFNNKNALLTDFLRIEIEHLKLKEEISDNIYNVLLSLLLRTIDKVANTTGVYGCYLKQIKGSAKKDLNFSLNTPSLQELYFIDDKKREKTKVEIYNENIQELIKNPDIKGDILYLDPPYNNRQYCDNYHILETLALYDFPVLKGKVGNRDELNKKSNFSIKKEVKQSFEDLIKNANFKYILISYNDEGLLKVGELKEILERYGKCQVYKKEYKRYKSKNIEVKSNINEVIYCLTKS